MAKARHNVTHAIAQRRKAVPPVLQAHRHRRLCNMKANAEMPEIRADRVVGEDLTMSVLDSEP
jgi:hypothetical protein